MPGNWDARQHPGGMPAMQSSPFRPIQLSLRQRLEFRAARWLFALPTGLQLWLSGRRPVVVENDVLNPQMQLLLALHAVLRGAVPAERIATQARQALRSETLTIAGTPITVGTVTD